MVATDLEAPQLGAGRDRPALDVTSERTGASWRDWLRAEHGRVDGLVNNAGIAMRDAPDGDQARGLERVMAVNVTGALLGIQTLAPLMPGGGSIVNVSSIAGVRATTGSPTR